MRGWIPLALACVCSLLNGSANAQAPPSPPPAAADTAAESPNDLFVLVGKSIVVNSSLPIERVSVGFGEIAEAMPVNPREILVNGKAPGETSLILWQQGGSKLFFDVTVRPSRFAANNRVESIRRELRKELPGQNVNLSFENDTVFLRGTVKNLTSADRAVSIAATLGKTVNLLYVDVPPPDAQILLKVRFASVDRNVSTELGLNLVSTGATNTVGSVTTQQFSPPQVQHAKDGSNTLTLSDALNIVLLRPDLNLAATIRALQRKALFEILAEPNVLAINGKQASFLAGGEFPYPTLQGGGAGLGAVTIQFREFGVRINFIPTITPRGTIRLQVAPEVSALDFANGLFVQGFNIPALTVRRVNTEIELDRGQSFAIGGLLDNRLTETLEKVPLLGDIPLLGKLMRSKSLHRENTELLVIITPELVTPTPAGSMTQIDFPKPFLEPNTGKEMRTPATGSAEPARLPPQSVPVETLIQSLAAQAPLTTGAAGAGGSGAANNLWPQQQAPVPALAPAPATPAQPQQPAPPASPRSQ